MEQFHADLEGGMSREEAQNRGMFRIAGQTAEMLAPGKGDLVEIQEPTFPTPNVTAPEEIAPNSGGTSRATIKASPPPPPGQTQRPGAPEPVTDVEVVKTNVDSPSSIKVQPPTAHQTDWTARGGAGTAPPAYRDGGGNVHVSSDHPLMGDGSRGGIPPVRPGAPKPAAPTATRAQPNSPPSTAKQTSDVGRADTGHAPAPVKPAADPMAKTPPAPQPAPASPQAQTGDAAAESQRPQAPHGHIDPPQAVSREVVESMRNRPRSTSPRKGRGSNINYSTDHGAHEQAWHRLGGHGDAPPAFIYDNQVYLDPSRFH